jgi:hypothetical protein
MSLELFSDLELVAVVDRVAAPYLGGVTLLGHVEDKPGSTMAIAARHNVVVGNFRAPGEFSYQIRYLGNGVHVVREIDESEFQPCGKGSALPSVAGVSIASGQSVHAAQ